MDKNAYNTLARAWQFAENRASEHQSHAMREACATLEGPEETSRASAVQASLLTLLARLAGVSSVIAVGSGNVTETMALAEGLDGHGMLTAVDSSRGGIDAVRRAFAVLSSERSEREGSITLRAVNAKPGEFLPRLNAEDYDMIMVAGDAANYADTFVQAPRLLRANGMLVLTDVLAFDAQSARGGVLNPADRSDKAVAMRALLESVDATEEFEVTLLPVGTGLIVARKK